MTAARVATLLLVQAPAGSTSQAACRPPTSSRPTSQTQASGPADSLVRLQSVPAADGRLWSHRVTRLHLACEVSESDCVCPVATLTSRLMKKRHGQASTPVAIAVPSFLVLSMCAFVHVWLSIFVIVARQSCLAAFLSVQRAAGSLDRKLSSRPPLKTSDCMTCQAAGTAGTRRLTPAAWHRASPGRDSVTLPTLPSLALPQRCDSFASRCASKYACTSCPTRC